MLGILLNLQLLCASSKDHTVAEPLIAADGAKLGECVTLMSKTVGVQNLAGAESFHW